MADLRIFLSHAESDSPFVHAVAAELRQRGVEAWLDAESIESGERFSDQVEAALRSASVVVAFFGDSSASPWLNFEIGAALGASKPVLPVFLSSAGRNEAPPQLQSLVSIDASDLKPDEVAEGIAETLATAA